MLVQAQVLQAPLATSLLVGSQRVRTKLSCPFRHSFSRISQTRVVTCSQQLAVEAIFNTRLEPMLDFASLSRTVKGDPDKPSYHVLPRNGWMNDPNGPIYYNGRYHLFYQHILNSCEWSFGLVWGHAVSTDLVHWEHLPPALTPTPGGPDADGCFSGCCVLDASGKPVILYTGVRLRSNPDCGPFPPPEHDLQLPFIETQIAAFPVPGDDMLIHWVKQETPLLNLPPANVPLAGWRDPFIFETGGNGCEWGMLLGTGIKEKGGATMIYRSSDLTKGWRFDGLLCESDDLDIGIMWECPILIALNRVQESPMKYRLSSGCSVLASLSLHFLALEDSGLMDGSHLLPTSDIVLASPRSLISIDGGDAVEVADDENGVTHMFCMSPDAPTNPSLYWLGRYDPVSSRFDLANAKGPFRLDLGDVLYAPNMMTDEKGRHLFWGWLQERRRVGTYDYSGCLSLPRVVYLRGSKFVQEPAPEVSRLRAGECWHEHDFMVFPENGTPVKLVNGSCLELEVKLTRGQSRAAGVHLRSWRADSEHAAIVVDWDRGVLEAVFADGARADLVTLTHLDPAVDGFRRVGGPIDLRPGEAVTLRMFVDSSCIEVYSSTGEVLSTRVYRGAAPLHADSGIELVSYGGAAVIEHVMAWEMSSIWKEDSWSPLESAEPVPSAALEHVMTLADLQALTLGDDSDEDSGGCACQGLEHTAMLHASDAIAV